MNLSTINFHGLGAFKRVIECGFGGGAKETALNPSEARLGRRAENEREGTQSVKVKFRSNIFCEKKVDIGEA